MSADSELSYMLKSRCQRLSNVLHTRKESFTFVPMSKGDFIAAQNAKCVLVSAAVKAPFPNLEHICIIVAPEVNCIEKKAIFV